MSANYGVFAADGDGQSPFPNIFRLSRWGNAVEAEPNNDHNTATAFEAPLALNGVIEKPGDVDHFIFKAKKGQTYDVSAYARRIRSPLDPILYIGKKGGGALVGNDDAAGPDSGFRFTAPDDGEYVVWLVDHLGKGGPEYFYRVELTPVEPRLSLNLQSEELPRGTGSVSVSVPKGGRQAILVYAGRENWGGDLKVAPENLPAGVTVENDIMPASQGVVPVLFKADAAAANAAKLARFGGQPVDANIKMASQQFTHTTVMVHGQNLVNFWSQIHDRMVVAVTDADERELRTKLASDAGRLPVPKAFRVETLPAQVLRQRPDLAALERVIAAASVPPVASTSSSTTTRLPLPIALCWISIVSDPYSSA